MGIVKVTIVLEIDMDYSVGGNEVEILYYEVDIIEENAFKKLH